MVGLTTRVYSVDPSILARLFVCNVFKLGGGSSRGAGIVVGDLIFAM